MNRMIQRLDFRLSFDGSHCLSSFQGLNTIKIPKLCDESESMKCSGRAICLLIARLLVQVAESSSAESDLEDSLGEGSSKQLGSWSQWWSYDGISGPDYWNINKQWRLCSLGRKQSPIEVRTERLVYDHLLGPIQLSWLPASATNYDDAILRKAAQTARRRERRESRQQRGAQPPVRVRLLNSGRGIEGWLEPGWQMGAAASSPARPPASHLDQQEQLIISRGPLSYAYKLFKIELHSAATAPIPPGAGKLAAAAPDGASSKQASHLTPQQWTGSSKSSEHLIDGRTFDGELQLHFYNKHLASSAIEAQQLANEANSPPSLFASIGVFLILDGPAHHQELNGTTSGGGGQPDQPERSRLHTSKSAIDFILDNLGAIQNEGDSIELQLTRSHIELLVPNKRQYVTYQGSMNRPPCAESVDWILINKALRVDRGKFEVLFEKLNTNQDNIRPFKALNRRLLRTTINNFYSGGGGAGKMRNLAHEDDHEGDANEVDEDDLDMGSDIDLERRSKQQQQQHAAGSRSCESESGGVSNKNCTSRLGPDEAGARDEIHNKLENNGIRRKGQPGSSSSYCSMKPNYAYQLRYGKQ